jgi:hypothetical protein
MQKYVAAACGAALVIAAASYSYAQPKGSDRKSGEDSTQSANPDPEKRGQKTGTTGKGPVTTPTPPGTDRQKGDDSQTSADPKRK